MKRLLALFLCLVMALTLIPAAYAEDIEIVDFEETDAADTGTEDTDALPAEGEIEVIDAEAVAEEAREKELAELNGFGDAISISTGKSYTGELTDDTAQIYYGFTLTKSGWINLKTDAENTKIFYRIYDVEGNELYRIEANWNDTTGSNKTNGWIALTKGTYYFEAGKDSSSYYQPGTNGTFSFRLDYSNANESFNDKGTNNNMASASSISVDTEYRGFLAENDGYDFFEFILKESGWINLKADAENTKIFYRIYDVEGNELYRIEANWNDTTGSNKTNGWVALTKGTYYFEAGKDSSSYYQPGTNGAFSFRLDYFNANESFNDKGTNNNIASASSISVNKYYHGFLAKNDSSDYFKFTLENSGNIRLSSVFEENTVYYYIYDINGTEKYSKTAKKDSSTGKNIVDDYVYLTAGTYYFSAQWLSYDGNSGAFEFYILEPNAKKPEITGNPSSVTAKEGDTVKLTVKASGNGLSYQWYYRTSSTGSWKKTTLTGNKTATLTVKATGERNGYQYYCKVYNAVGTSYSKSAKLTIMTKPVITTQPKSVKVYVDTTAKFTVKATGGGLSYQWYYRQSSSDSWKKTTLTGATTATLTVTGKSTRNGWQYRCKVSNSLGYTYSDTATLTVSVKPVITTQPSSKTVTAGKTVKFIVKADGAASYQWYYRTSSTGEWKKCSGTGATTATLTIEAKSYRSGYQYRCRVSNDAGYVYSSAATLTVGPSNAPGMRD